MRTFLKQNSGSTACEYALLLAIVTGSIAVVAMAMSGQTRDVILGMSDELPNAPRQTARSRATTTPTGTVASDSFFSDSVKSWLPSRTVTVRVAFGTAIAMVVTAGIAYWARRRRPPPLEPTPKKSHAPPDNSALETQLYARRQRILQALINDPGLLVQSKMQVRHLLHGEPPTILPRCSRQEIAATMKEKNSNYLLVCDKRGDYQGLVGRRDLSGPSGKRAVDLLDDSLSTVSPDAPVSQAITLLMDGRQSCLPVVQNGRLRGCLSKDDLVLTLQCALQLFVRVAQFAHLESGEAASAENAAISVENELVAQERMFDRLQQLVKGIEEEGDGVSRVSLANEGTRLLQQGRELASQIQTLQQHMSGQFERLTSIFDLTVDPATGAGNRRSFHTLLSMHSDLSRRYKSSFCVLLVTSDVWRASEDRLRSVAKWLNQTVRAVDTVARYDVDTFALILPQIGLAGARQTAERLLASASEEEWDGQTSTDRSPPRVAVIAVGPDLMASGLRTRLEDLLKGLRDSEPGTMLIPDGSQVDRQIAEIGGQACATPGPSAVMNDA